MLACALHNSFSGLRMAKSVSTEAIEIMAAGTFAMNTMDGDFVASLSQKTRHSIQSILFCKSYVTTSERSEPLLVPGVLHASLVIMFPLLGGGEKPPLPRVTDIANHFPSVKTLLFVVHYTHTTAVDPSTTTWHAAAIGLCMSISHNFTGEVRVLYEGNPSGRRAIKYIFEEPEVSRVHDVQRICGGQPWPKNGKSLSISCEVSDSDMALWDKTCRNPGDDGAKCGYVASVIYKITDNDDEEKLGSTSPE